MCLYAAQMVLFLLTTQVSHTIDPPFLILHARQGDVYYVAQFSESHGHHFCYGGWPA